MLKKILELKDVEAAVLSELSSSHLFPFGMKLKLASQLAESLDLNEKSVLTLGRRECNLVKVDKKKIDFMLTILQQQTDDISRKLYEADRTRIEQSK